MVARYLIADDHPLFRQALEAVIVAHEPTADVRCVGTLPDAIAEARALDPAMVFLDLVLPGAERLSGLSAMREAAPRARVAIVSARREPALVGEARAMGAIGFVPKALELDALHQAIGRLLHGEGWFPDPAPDHAEATDTDAETRIASLSPAQRLVLAALLEGHVNKHIARDLDISLATVKAHVSAVLRKLGVETRTQAVLLARPFLTLSDE